MINNNNINDIMNNNNSNNNNSICKLTKYNGHTSCYSLLITLLMSINGNIYCNTKNFCQFVKNMIDNNTHIVITMMHACVY